MPERVVEYVEQPARSKVDIEMEVRRRKLLFIIIDRFPFKLPPDYSWDHFLVFKFPITAPSGSALV